MSGICGIVLITATKGVPMIIYEGTYQWEGKKRTSSTPVSWWPGSYNIKIIDLNELQPGVHHIKPYVCIFSDTGNGFSVRNTFQHLAVAIGEKFGLDPSKVLWIEHFPGRDSNRMDAATIEPVTVIGTQTIYKASWRPIMANEITLVRSCLPEQ